jgi:hypothetical protein
MMNQQITFLSDGGDMVRELQLCLNPQAEHLLNWFHVTAVTAALLSTLPIVLGCPSAAREDAGCVGNGGTGRVSEVKDSRDGGSRRE